MALEPEPISAAAFKPFGALLDRKGAKTATASLRAEVPTWVEIIAAPVVTQGLHSVDCLERHKFATQTFIPIDVEAYLVLVCPHGDGGGPDLSQLHAFRVPGDTVIQYHADTWHAGMTALGGGGRFANVMSRDFSDDDCEFHPLSDARIEIRVGET